MKKSIIWILILVVVIVLISVLVSAADKNDGENRGNENGQVNVDSSLVEYFQDKMIERALGGMIGMPIEGFDSGLLIGAYPGLLPSDFDGVEAFEGHYEVRGGMAEFVRDQEQPVSSAERTISDEGYATLLNNLADRLNWEVNDQSDIDALIDEINLGDVVKAKINETAGFLSVKVTPKKLLEDSRCPIDVQCIQAGTVRVEATLQSASGTSTQVFELNKTVTTEAENITLVNVDPVKEANKTVATGEYTFYFDISKRQ